MTEINTTYSQVSLQKIVATQQKKLSEISKRLLSAESECASLVKLVNNLQAALLEVAPRISKLEEELNRQRGRIDSGWYRPVDSEYPEHDG